ncbi:MAG: methyltransferase [Alphaproteobacteria bacterium]|nr:methyltransferase [Alphaproteobacteria bacterium]
MPTLERLFPQGLSQDRLLGGRVQLAQPLGGYRVAVDPVLLAAAVPARAGELAADFGAGSGAVGLCLAARVQGCRVVGLEREPDLAALTRANAARSGLGDRVFVVCADAGAPPLAEASVDHVAMNPPYLPATAATQPQERLRRVGAIEGKAGLATWIASAWPLVRRGGTVSLIHRADRLDEIVAQCRRCQPGGLTIVPIWPHTGQPARRVVVRLRKDDRSPLNLLPGLVLHEADGRFTAAADAVLREAAGLALP